MAVALGKSALDPSRQMQNSPKIMIWVRCKKFNMTKTAKLLSDRRWNCSDECGQAAFIMTGFIDQEKEF